MLNQLLLIFHVLLAISIIGLVLVQHGKGAEAGAAFGSGASSTIFGSQGTSSFMTRTIAILACCFAFTSISLSLIANRSRPATLTERLERLEQEQQEQRANSNLNSDLPAVPTVSDTDSDTENSDNKK